MVTKAIERAQTTVETRNAEIRKNVLKYDEVMNEQRKVIYARRDQILEGDDLKSAAMEYLAEAVDALLETHCASRSPTTSGTSTGWPRSSQRSGRRSSTDEQLGDCRNTDEMYDLVMADATAHYEQREDELGADGDARGRAPGDAAHHRPALARAPRGDGLPQGGHQPAGDGPEGPAHRVAARGLRDVRGDDEGHRPGLRALRDARPGRRRQRRAAEPHRRARTSQQTSAATTVRLAATAPPAPQRRRLPSRGVAPDGRPAERRRRDAADAPGDRRARPAASRPKQETVVKDEWSTRRRATRRARAGPARSSSCATALPERRSIARCVTSPTTCASCVAASTRPRRT